MKYNNTNSKRLSTSLIRTCHSSGDVLIVSLTKVKFSNTNKIDLKSKIFLRFSSREEIGFKVKVDTSANKNNNNRNLPAVNIPGLIVNSNKM